MTLLTRLAQPTISAIERGLLQPHPEWRRRLAKAFGMPEAELFAPDETPDVEPLSAERVSGQWHEPEEFA